MFGFNKFLDWFSEIADRWDTKGIKFTLYTTIAVVIGGLFELIPPFFLTKTVTPISTVKPYSALELAGRDTYQKEGCIGCHTQMVRPFKWEVDRFDPTKAYGRTGYSKGGEYVYDHPFLWGSKRTGPDLAHESQMLRSDEWHKNHLINPRTVGGVPNSIMPAYPWLFEESHKIDVEQVVSNMKALKSIGVPYTEEDFANAPSLLKDKTEGQALVAYLQKLGKDSAELQKGMK
ncbi:putative cytochrome c oxidase, cbb3-type, subunit II [Leptospira wolbachii serovar Codice str. CDC]|uniref:Cytochrome c oxidase, cbb3-type, subunit II n=1 Tax=Leptospira wolbachii serovar Codice str. CDC TaxID=1218599 RepID=R8ZY86_9LEPT|nr:cytochrome-c oxidase, cbb3-type subunit II [Leptospira wolbachii]EOQ94946.1 putative cytochrome c oxidase, cbb3-type, subunit II [Leptospira wolbachii serovar Codice str. CDC]